MKTTIFLILVLLVSCKSKNKTLTNSFNEQYEKALAEQEKIREQQRQIQEKFKKQQEDIQTLKTALSLEYGAEFETVKSGSHGNEMYMVFKNSSTGEYVAYNLAKWDSKTMSSFSQYVGDSDDIVTGMERKEEWVSAGRYEDIIESQYYSTSEFVTEVVMVPRYNEYDSVCLCYRDIEVGEVRSYWKETSGYKDVVLGQRYIDESSYQSFYYGGGFRFENAASSSKDLDLYAHGRQAMNEESLAARFKSQYSLSTDRAKELANLSVKYMKLENTRALTANEKDHFAKKSLGVSMNQIEEAMKAKAMGYDAEYDSLLSKAAQVNKTTPEMIGKFFNEVME